MNQIVFSAHTHLSAFTFAALSLSTTHPAGVASLICILKLARYPLRKLCWLLRKRQDVLGAELKENHLYLIYLACNQISFCEYMNDVIGS